MNCFSYLVVICWDNFIYVICWDNFIFVGGKKRKKIKDRKEKGKMSIVEGRRKESGGDGEESDIFPGIGYNMVTGKKFIVGYKPVFWTLKGKFGTSER